MWNAAVAYAAPMPEETKSELYKREIRKLLTTIKNLRGITKEVKELKELAETIQVDIY